LIKLPSQIMTILILTGNNMALPREKRLRT